MSAPTQSKVEEALHHATRFIERLEAAKTDLEALVLVSEAGDELNRIRTLVPNAGEPQ